MKYMVCLHKWEFTRNPTPKTNEFVCTKCNKPSVEKKEVFYHVNKALQIILIFIPLLNLWAWWRVGKIWKGAGINVLMSALSYLIIIPDVIISEYNQDLGLVFFTISLFSIYIPAIYFMNKWTNQRNALYHKQEEANIGGNPP